VLAAALALGASACVSGFDRNDQTVNSLRILGASMHIDNGDGIDWADAEPGDTVTFKVLLANPTNIPSVKVSWVACVPPSLNNPVTPCISEQVLRNPVQLIDGTYGPSTGVVPLGVGETFQFTIPTELSALTDQLITRAKDPMTKAAQCSLFIEAPVIIIAQGSDGSVVTAIKYLRLSPWSKIGPTNTTDQTLWYYVRNANPTIDALITPTDQSACAGQTLAQTLVQSCSTDADCTYGGPCSSDGWCPPAKFPAGPTTICGRIRDSQTDATGADTDIQTYYYCGIDGKDGQEMEYPAITWYQTGGGQAAIANTNTTGVPTLAARTFLNFTRPTGEFTLYGVVRDGRDGENWIAQTFSALP
jgi:hypothetical protein